MTNYECLGSDRVRHSSFVIRHCSLVLLAVLVAVLAACARKPGPTPAGPLERAYDSEQDWNDPQHLIPLNYEQSQGKRIFYSDCVWCHADATPAGPSNRSNLTPVPALSNDGTVLNVLSNEYLQNIIALGGSAVGKSASMPPWGKILNQDEIRAVIAYMRAIAQPPYRAPAPSASQYLVK
ncbi:MAG TPA: cytochrome c [Acidobacteriota bacterium]|nr:cytochrome c [Acidobacteriota bacterium]